MSFDLFVGCFQDGERAQFRATLIGKAFGQFAIARGEGCLTVCFGRSPEDNCYLYYDTESEMIDAFSVERPKGDPRLFQAIFDVLKSGHMALYMPGNCPPLIARQESAAHLPSGMIEALGEPAIITRGDEIACWIDKA